MEGRKKTGKRTITDWPSYRTMDYFKRTAITKALKFFNGNSTRAAIALGISLKTVRNLKNKYNLHTIGDHDPVWDKKLKELRASIKQAK